MIPIKFPEFIRDNLYTKDIPGDGHCFFHSILYLCSKKYCLTNASKMCEKFRKEIYKKLISIDSEDTEDIEDIENKINSEEIDSEEIDSEEIDSEEINSEEINSEEINSEEINSEEIEDKKDFEKRKTYYQNLFDGEIENFSKINPFFSLSEIKKNLLSNQPISDCIIYFLGDILNRDIYILKNNGTVYNFGSDNKVIYKDRLSIILYYNF